MLHTEGWGVNHKCVERLWRREGLKVPAKQPKRSRLWLNDGSGLKYLLTDQLGSVVAVTDNSGSLLSQQRYLPFGGVRTDVGNITQTDFAFREAHLWCTGQRNLDAQGNAALGLDVTCTPCDVISAASVIDTANRAVTYSAHLQTTTRYFPSPSPFKIHPYDPILIVKSNSHERRKLWHLEKNNLD